MSTMFTMTQANRPLPPKENALFKRILKCYDHKLYKNGLKLAKQILSNSQFGDHAETLGMKGLLLNELGRREEAYEYVRRGLRNDVKSHVCWHVYGILQRSERKYDEAIKCYRNALKLESSSIQIMRELSIAQVHIRDLIGYRETRSQMFQLKPAQRASWVGVAMSYHLLKDYDMSYKILDAFRKTLNPRETYDQEKSELLLYQSTVLEESGDLTAAKKFLLDHEHRIYDKYTRLESICRIHLGLGEYGQAESAYHKLIGMNQENEAYYHGLAKALQIENNSVEKLKMYKEICEQYPRAYLPKWLSLDCTEGEEFMRCLRPYIMSSLGKEAPALFTELKPLYKDPEKTAAIQELVETIELNLKNLCRFVDDETEEIAPAASLLWTYYYLARHYDHLRDSTKALNYIDKAIDHTPTLIELLMCKAKIFKHAGDVNNAATWMEEARELDTADRFLNSKSAKYLLRANNIHAAESVCGKFTKEGTVPMDNLNEMQCMWFQTECALAYQRTGQLGHSLKKCHEVERHFTEIIEDQYDFHSYCLRKMTLRSYMQLLRLEDVLRTHPFYFKAAKCAIEVYIHLYDHPLESQSVADKISPEGLSPAELKKLRNKQRKAKKKAEIEEQAAAGIAEKKVQHSKSAKQAEAGESPPPPSEELLPEKLASISEPIQQAIKFLLPLQSFAADKIDTQLLAYEIYSRKDKPLLMLQSIKRALKIDPNHPKLQKFLFMFYQAMETRKNSLPDPLPQFMNNEIDKIYGQISLDKLNLSYLETKDT